MRIIKYIVILLSLPLAGQVSSPLGRYQVDYARGCAPLTINVTEIMATGGFPVQYFYETPTNITGSISLTHTYNNPGTYYLVQLIGNDALNPKTDTLRIEVFNAIPPTFDYFFCDNREVNVTINDLNYDSYDVSFAGNPPTNLLNGQSVNYTYALIDPLSISVKGRYSGAPDNCGESIVVLPDVKSVLIAPDPDFVRLTQSCENTFHLEVLATTEQGVTYEIEWNKDGGAYSPLFEGQFSGTMLFENVNFTSGNSDYCVRINAVDYCDNSRVLGNPSCNSVAPASLNPIQEIYSTYVDQAISIILDPVSSGSFVFQRSFDGTNFSTINESPSSYTDPNPFQGRQYFYRVSYKDTCNTVWDQQNTAPPFVRAKEIGTNSYEITFDPAIHSSSNAFNYQGVLTGSGGSTSIPVSAGTFILKLPVSLGEKQQFVITGTSGSTVISSNTLNLNFEFVIYVPKAFTPNNDGLNDRLEFFGLDGANAELKIYTRWGQQIYGELSSAPAWDGRINGKLADEGVYVYEISIPEQANHRQKGTFALIKK
jgi:gliding motility-associated-like protein